MNGPEERLVKLCELAAQQVEVDPSIVKAETNLFSDLNFDSLDAVEYTMEIEDAFDVSIPDDESQEIRTVAQAAALLERHLQLSAAR